LRRGCARFRPGRLGNRADGLAILAAQACPMEKFDIHALGTSVGMGTLSWACAGVVASDLCFVGAAGARPCKAGASIGH
jgi:hypothetical protein